MSHVSQLGSPDSPNHSLIATDVRRARKGARRPRPLFQSRVPGTEEADWTRARGVPQRIFLLLRRLSPVVGKEFPFWCNSRPLWQRQATSQNTPVPAMGGGLIACSDAPTLSDELFPSLLDQVWRRMDSNVVISSSSSILHSFTKSHSSREGP